MDSIPTLEPVHPPATALPLLDAVPAPAPQAPPALPAPPPPAPQPDRGSLKGEMRTAWGVVSFLFGWPWRLFLGSLLALNTFTSLVLLGWLNRWTQGQVVYLWWLRGRARKDETFADFSESLGLNGPVTRPRLVLRENWTARNIHAELFRPTADAEPPSYLRLGWRGATLPFRSLLNNFKSGFVMVLCTYLLTGWGCLLMEAGWEGGWLNSFNKGYEQAGAGAAISLLGIVLFVAAMFYVPLAQVHMAVTGEARAFFDFRFVWQVVRARLSGCVLLVFCYAAFGLLMQIVRLAPVFFDGHFDYWTNASNQELASRLGLYYWACAGMMLVGLMVLRWFAGLIYLSGVLKVLRRGRVKPEQLHPFLAKCFDRLGLIPTVQTPSASVLRVFARRTGRWWYRAFLYTLLFVVWLHFTLQCYVSEFLNYHPYTGFANHPLVHFPSFDLIPKAPPADPVFDDPHATPRTK
jgi:hypothetical protein